MIHKGVFKWHQLVNENIIFILKVRVLINHMLIKNLMILLHTDLKKNIESKCLLFQRPSPVI